MKKMVYPDKEPMVIIRTCTKAICCQNSPATKLLAVLLYWYDRSDCEDNIYTVGRTQDQLVVDACNELTVRTLHDIAAPMLEALGYIDIVTSDSGKVHYTVHVDKVNEALEAYKHGTLNNFLQRNLDDKIEKFLIQIDPKEIEKFPNELEKFLFILEKFLIPIRKISNSKRGRKPSTEAASRAKSKSLESNRDFKETLKRESKTVVLQPLLPSSPPSQNGHKPSSQSKTEGTKQPTQLRSKDEIVLTEEEQRIFDLYCQAQSLKVPPKLTEDRKRYCASLAPHVDSYEEMISLVEFAKKWLKKRNIHVKVVELGNMVKSDVLNNWEKPTVNQPELVPDTDETTIVAWSKHPERLPKLQKEVLRNWKKYRAMTIAEAKKYGWDESVSLTPSLQNQVLSRLELHYVDGVSEEELTPEMYQIA